MILFDFFYYFFFFGWMGFCVNHWEIKNKSPLGLPGLGRIILNSAEEGRRREDLNFLFESSSSIRQPCMVSNMLIRCWVKVPIIKCNFPCTAKVHRFPGSQLLVTFSVYLWLNMNINELSFLLTLPFPNLFTTILSFCNERRKKKKKAKCN